MVGTLSIRSCNGALNGWDIGHKEAATGSLTDWDIRYKELQLAP